MLIKDDKYFFNIDFEHIFNQKTKFNDAPRFAIHSNMKLRLAKLVLPLSKFLISGTMGKI